MAASLIEMAHFLEATRIPVRLGCKTKSGWPLVVSLWFLHQDGRIFCATQESARVVQYLKKEPRCGFEIAADQPPYCGVRGQAKSRIDKTLGAEILEKLLIRYLGNLENPLAKNLLAKAETEVAIVLEPVRVFTWDFSQRMAGIGENLVPEKVCP